MTIEEIGTRQSPNDLEVLRAQLDRVDEQLREVLRARLDCCIRIAEHKREHAVPMMQPHRIGIVQDRAARFARKHGISESFIRSLYDLIIGETCRVETIVIDGR